MPQIESVALEALAASFVQRAEQADAAVEYTRSGYLKRESLGLMGMVCAFQTAARELRVLAHGEPGDGEGER